MYSQNRYKILGQLWQNSHTDRIAAVDDSESMSFSELQNRSEAIASWLIQNYPGKKPIAVFGDKENDMLCCMFAAFKSGHPYVCLPSFYPEGKIDMILRDCNAEVVLNPARQQIHETGLPVLSHSELRSLANGYDRAPIDESHYVKQYETLLIMYTSGSIGMPKGVCLSRRNIEKKIEIAHSFMSTSIPAENGRAVSLAAYSFSASLSFVYYALLQKGCTLYSMSRKSMMDTRAFVASLCAANPHMIACTPSFAERIMDCPQFCAENMPSLCYICFGGEALHVDVVRRFHMCFPNVRIVNGYGVTEAASAPLTCDITEELMEGGEAFMPVGAFPNENVYLVDQDGRRIAKNGEVGELHIACDAVSKGYLNCAEETSRVFYSNDEGKWAYRTRDVMKIQNGHLYFMGRKDNQVKVGGNRFELEDVEAHLRRVENVRECAAAVVNTVESVGVLMALVVRRDDTVPHIQTVLTIKQKLKRELESYMIPSKIYFVSSLPKNVNQKIDRVAVQQMLERIER